MALSRPDIIRAVKNRIYNSGVGQKPSVREGTGTATVTGDKVAFDLAAGEGAKVRKGQILTKYGSTDKDDAFGFYILSVTTDSLVCVNGYNGVAIANAAAIPVLLEHQAEPNEYDIQAAIDDIVASYLFPELFDIVVDTFTPNMQTLQSDANALDVETIRAWQLVGPTLYQVPINLIQNMPTGNFASGKMLAYNVRLQTDVSYSVKRKIDIAVSTDPALVGLIAKGAAALCIEGVEEAPDEDGEQVSRPLWASFYNAKRQMENSIAKESVTQFKIDRG